MDKRYSPKTIEPKWQKEWEEKGIFRQYDRKKRFYVLDMFPYPSGTGLHVGHPKGYIATDVVARMKQLQGFGVLHPMGWDAFGLPAEQFAIKNKMHPSIAVKENIGTYKKQMEAIGFSYDWEREIDTTDPEYYRWTQWIFLKMFEKGLAYESYEPINWCPSCQTGLANEDLEDGACERCGTQVEKKPMRQWVLRMTAYADRLLADLDRTELDWEEQIKEQQRNWIGRSEGAEVEFQITNSKSKIRVFTTRVDTIFGCTYVVVAPEHRIIADCELQIVNFGEVEEYLEKTKKKSDLERTELNKEKTGVKLEGIEAVNPFTGESVPVYVADYVLGSYGTGAVMAVPAHDERDFEFAKKYGLDISTVVSGGDQSDEVAFTEDGMLVNSGDFSGLSSAEAREKMMAWIEEKGLGRKSVKYKMRDWTFSRQRYWGEPIPIVHCEECGAVPVKESDLPVRLPDVESYEPTGTGESPLADIDEWVNVPCPKCGGAGKRETNTMPQWAGSCWYYLRFIDPKNGGAFVGEELEREWMPVDLYVGGAEHATRHLLYARFWHKFLFDIGVVSTDEPFKRLVHVGLINASDGRKMSKRWGNVVNPDDIIRDFGADALRLYEMFMGPFTQNIAWNTEGLVGTRRFLDKIWKLSEKVTRNKERGTSGNEKLEAAVHRTIRKVTEDVDDFKFNTAISALMILANAMEKENHVSDIVYREFLILLSPFAPHIAEELWERSGNEQSIFLEKWPQYDPEKAVEMQVTIAVSVNGKVRDIITVARDASEETLRSKALSNEKVRKYLEEKEPKKVIVVPGRIVNIVI
ncbi:MAG: leucine--tRNA ligase [Candidatus Moranbacteria bacterium]|nr:leucine--tRNA ligase [Candidatus Moranbacteria bacterium]